MKQILALVTLFSCLALFVAAVPPAIEDPPAEAENSSPALASLDQVHAENLVNFLLPEKDFLGVEPQGNKSAYRAKIIRALSAYLSRYNMLKNLKKPEGRKNFESAISKLKSLCIRLNKHNENYGAPKAFLPENWELLMRVTNYVLVNKMLLPDDIYRHLTDPRRW